MTRLLGFLFALVLLGSLTQEIILNYMPYVNMVNYGGSEGQIVGLAVLFVPLAAMVILYRIVMKIVHKLLYRKGEW